MKSILIVFVFAFCLFAAFNYLECQCSRESCCLGGCGVGYHGSLRECYCWANENAKRIKAKEIKATYNHDSSVLRGTCMMCATSYNVTSDSSIANVPKDNHSRNLEDPAKISLIPKFLQKEPITTLIEGEGQKDSEAGPLLIYQCYCPGGLTDCKNSIWSGSYQNCVDICKGLVKKFVTGNYKITWFPSGGLTRGGCSCCGDVDPCNV